MSQNFQENRCNLS